MYAYRGMCSLYNVQKNVSEKWSSIRKISAKQFVLYILHNLESHGNEEPGPIAGSLMLCSCLQSSLQHFWVCSLGPVGTYLVLAGITAAAVIHVAFPYLLLEFQISNADNPTRPLVVAVKSYRWRSVDFRLL